MVSTAADTGLRLTPDTFDRLFPFHLGFNRAGVLTHAGPSFRRLSSTTLLGRPLAEILCPHRPDVAFDFVRIAESGAQLYTVRAVESDVLLRGEMCLIEETMFFLGTPWFHDTAELARLGLSLSDFALSDPTLDLLQVLQMQKISTGDLKQFAQTLTASTTLLKSVVDAMPLGVVIRDDQGRILLTNNFALPGGESAAEADCGRSGNQEANLTLIPHHPEGGCESVAADRASAFEIEREISGRKCWLRCIKFRVPGPDHGAARTGTLILDMTGRKQLEEELRAASERQCEYLEMQREFISLVSHEFRTPLTAIEGSHYLMRKLLSPPEVLSGTIAEKAGKWFDLQAAALTTLKELVNQVLLLNRIEHRAQKEALALSSPGTLVEGLVEHFNHTVDPPRVTLQNDLPGGFEASMDRELIKTAVENLISNALKYSWTDRLVRVRAWREPDAWSVEVVDQGRGIPDADQQRIFQTFFRASNVDKVSGSGLGLVIVKRAVDYHGGRIDFSSKHNIGSRFALHIPMAPPPPAPAVESRGPFPTKNPTP
ncbi:MAG: hypothetical protein HZA93_19265 [Verrucomicrobia bacterium]|nr:hypothetical protein [Verrucomicrobiota bacterium]